MAIPDRATAEPQVWPGHAPVPSYETPMYQIGRKGLNLVDGIDTLDPQELSRMVNVFSVYGGPLTVRPGETALGTTAGVERIHSLFRLNDPGAGAFARFAGSNANLFRGTTGAFANVDSGYSGDPLTFTGVTMPLSGTPYVIVSDRSRQRKINRTAAVEAFGIPPGVLTSTALLAAQQKSICDFTAADGSAAASWAVNAGFDRAVPPNASGAPVVIDIFAGAAIQATTAVGAATGPYYSFINLAHFIDLSIFSIGNPTSDDDQIHLLFNVSAPQWLEEIKIYLCISTPFVGNSIPGDGGGNTDAWFKSFRPNDLQPYFEQMLSGLDSSDTLRLRTLIEQFKTDQPGDLRASLIDVTGSLDLNRQNIPQIAAGRNIWGEFGILGVPLRRGDFQRIGTNLTYSWATMSGICIVMNTNSANPIQFQFDAWYIHGGSGPDASDVGASSYDVRVTNYNPVTGSEGNPSAEQAAAAFLNPLRQTIRAVPTASGTAALRQKAYLRGGSSTGTQNWFFAGQNAADGGNIDIIVGDDERILDDTLEIDNDQPVTSVNPTTGATILNQTLPVYFQVETFTFGLGDPNRPGTLYRSKSGKPEQWPADETEDVCASTEELMNGGQIASQGFVFSRTRMYAILLSPDNSWTTEPTACNEGMVGRWAMAVTPFGVAFVSPFGVRLTSGGVPERLSDEQVEPLFRGETFRGLAPIDFTVPTALQLAYYDDELWLTYQDTGGVRRQLIFNFFSKNWRSYLFGTTVSCVYGEPVQGLAASTLLGSNAAGAIYTHSGFSDLGTPIAFSFRTGAWDYGDPRNEKLFGEVVLDAEIGTGTVSAAPFLNDELTAVTAQSVTGIAGLRRYSFEPFGTGPQRARNVAIELSGNASTSLRPYFNLLGVSHQRQPEIVFNLPTPWEELPGGEGYVWGVIITCDTGNTSRSVEVEYTSNNGGITSAGTLTVLADGRKKLPFTLATAVLAQQIRLRPTGACIPWIRYKVEWLSDPEPPRVTGWNTNWESMGTMADKWIKGYLLEADTFNVAKTVVLDIDQALVANSQSLTFNGRGIQHIAFAKLRGRLFRIRATDANFGKFYKWQPIFDEEPLQLTRWQTQERPHEGMSGKWQKPLEAWISIRSSGTVTLQITSFGASGATLNTSSYNIPTTAGAKQKVRVPLNAAKGLLFEYLFTAAAGFWLYKEESELLVEDWNSGQSQWCPLPASNDDLDPARQMGNARVAAQTPGGA